MAAMSDITPDFVYSQETKFNVLVTKFENEVAQRRLKGQKMPKVFRLVFVNRSKTDYLYVQNFLEARYGPYEVFTWMNKIDNVVYSVCLVEKSFKVEWRRYSSYNFEFSLEEQI